MATEIKLLPCPFCGEVPTLTKKQMWQGSHGYYGCYGFSVKCENEDCAITPFTRTFDTIYEKDENKQKKKAIAAWNRRADHIRDTTKMVSNADRIWSMSDEELAKEMLFFVPSDFKKHYTGLSGGYFATADEAIQASLDWLQQPAKEEV